MTKITTMAEVLERAKRRELIAFAKQGAPPTNRDRAVKLRKQGLSVEQISIRLGINKQTVYSHISNAKKAGEVEA